MACEDHKELEYRVTQNRRDIDAVEKEIKEVRKAVKNPVVAVAIIGLFGTVFSGTMAFVAVITAPIIRAWLGL